MGQSYWQRKQKECYQKLAALDAAEDQEQPSYFTELLCTGCARYFTVDSEDERVILDTELIYCDACNEEAEQWVEYQREVNQ